MMGAVANLVLPDNRRRLLVEAALAPDILLGMPHLTPFGLSETWLMKELAHRHWLLLGQMLGLPDADFRSANGGEVYAAICASALRHGAFEQARANDVLSISTSIAPAGSTHMVSLHRLFVHAEMIGEVELVSTFVHRLQQGRNGSVARIRMALDSGTAASNALVDVARSLRRAEISSLNGFSLQPGEPLREFTFQPIQNQDFNGAGLFYFANFLAACDRALAHWSDDDPVRVLGREVYYLGNIEPGEPVTILLQGQSDDGRLLHMALVRPDGAVILHQILQLHAG